MNPMTTVVRAWMIIIYSWKIGNVVPSSEGRSNDESGSDARC